MQEHSLGVSIFQNAHYPFHMKQMMRFEDDVLVRSLHTMRTVNGKALAEGDWKALSDTESPQEDSRAGKPAMSDTGRNCSAVKPTEGDGWYHTCYVWSVIAMAAFIEALESA